MICYMNQWNLGSNWEDNQGIILSHHQPLELEKKVGGKKLPSPCQSLIANPMAIFRCVSYKL